MPSSGPPAARPLPKPADIEGALAEVLARWPDERRALIGGVALAVYGVERYTKDADLAVTEAGSADAARLLADADPRPLRIGGVSVATSAGARVDLIDRRFGLRGLYEEAIEAARERGPRVRIAAAELAVVPLPFLIAMKMAADRPQDEADLDHLMRHPELDYPATRALVERHLGFFAAQRLDFRLCRAVTQGGHQFLRFCKACFVGFRFGEFGQFGKIVQFLIDLADGVHLAFKGVALLHKRLGVLWIIPKRRVFHARVQLVEFALGLIPVKDASSAVPATA